ncbi:MAG: hypothetical protein C6I01_05705 [Epsilonproteobacteria bacterium]|nr:hypothetical protein [Campylobacterota bacterium]NPA88619.1 hypothetical protein [Campylobacterota bacterium]
MEILEPEKELQFTYLPEGYWSNRNWDWLGESDLIIYWRALPQREKKENVKTDGESAGNKKESKDSSTSPLPFVPKLGTNYAIVGGEESNSQVDIPLSSKILPLLLARLAMVFELFDPQLDQIEECEFLREELNGVRIKPELANHNTTLEEVAGLLYLIEKASKISVIIGEDTPEPELTQLFKFLSTIGLLKGKVGVFSPLSLSEFTDFSFCEE